VTRWDRRLFDAGQNLPLVGPFLLVLLATLVFRFTDADLLISGMFHDGASKTGFQLADHPLLVSLYHWGVVPAWMIGLGSLAVVAAAAFRNVSPQRRLAAIFLLSLLVLGPVLLVNVVYKGYWGRPRPDQTMHFGGNQPFLHVMEKGPANGFCSFPSGHAAAGFCLIAPAFLLYRRRPRLASAWWVFGLTCGLVIGLGRVMQGRHFASDVLWAAAIVYFTGCALDYLLLAGAVSAPRRRTMRAEVGHPAAPAAASVRTGGKQAPSTPPTQPRRKAA
jgi:lipid A 4'-phosphatase